MRFDIDTYREILDTITRNKSRSALTGFGVFWGVFMLVALLGGANVLRQKLESNFEGFATNSSMVMAQPTTKPYNGYGKGRTWYLDTRDAERLRQAIPELDVITPVVFGWSRTVVRGKHTATGSIQGVAADYCKVDAPQISYGRNLNENDIRLRRKVCVIGKQIYETLFPEGGDPCGKRIRIDSNYYSVVGVNSHTGGISFNGESGQQIVLPESLVRTVYNRGDQVDMLAVTGKGNVKMSSLAPRIRATLGRAHSVDPADEQAMMVFNTEAIFMVVSNLFRGVDILVWLVGIGTLLAGSIGVSNIMMVTVKERTSEIGIRRAIGATPRTILSQIMAESVALTSVAGAGGILFAIALLQAAETIDRSSGAHWQVDFWTAVLAMAFIVLLGVVAGLAPALRAMGVKPVEAMREE